jgi:uncharacterized membrane protein YfcA
MSIYLPIAEMSASVPLFVGMGAAVGFLAGLFGVGGGFLMTPLLIFSGIPSAVAVGTEAAQIVASSVSGALAQWRRRNIDVKMGTLLLAGGVVGAGLGVRLVGHLRTVGQFELMLGLAYVLFLGIIGILMLVESIGALRRARAGLPVQPRARRGGGWFEAMPFKTRFERSQLRLSVLPPLGLGFIVGVLAGFMGIGGGFIMVPAMIYLLRMPTGVVIGTSLFQIVFVTAATTVLHASQNFTVDLPLALMLITGGVVGAQLGAVAGDKLKAEQLRFLLAALVLLVGVRMAWDLVVPPTEPYSLTLFPGRR